MKSYRLADVIRIKHGYAFSGEYIRDNDNDNGIVLVTPGNFKIGGGFQEDKCKFYTGDIPNEYILKGGDLVVTMTDLSKTIDTLGYSAYIPLSSRIYLHNQRIGLVTLISDEFDKDYIYWLMRTQYYQRKIANSSTGATVHHTSPSKIYEFKFEAPDINVQKKISSILTSYEKLIENNNKRIKILEQMAENLYKEWFVRFRFPGYETAEFVDGVPKGWKYRKLKSLLEIFYGKDHKKIADGDIPIFGSGGIMRYGNKLLYDGEVVLIPRKGTLNNIMYYSGKVWTVDTMFYAVSKIPNTAKYIYYTLNNFDMESYNSGAALPSMTTAILYNLKILLPDEKTLEKYDSFVGKLFEEKECLEKQNQNLIKQRDYLLPRLMSGKLQVK